MIRKIRRAQTIIEYVLIVAVVAAALTAMTDYVHRAIQANLKTLEDKVNATAL